MNMAAGINIRESIDLVEKAYESSERTVYVVMFERDLTVVEAEYTDKNICIDCCGVFFDEKLACEYVMQARGELERLNSIELMTYQKYAHTLSEKSLSWDQRMDIEKNNAVKIKKALLETNDFPILKGFYKEFYEDFFRYSGSDVADKDIHDKGRPPFIEFFYKEVKLIT